jgi:hypothetical protein
MSHRDSPFSFIGPNRGVASLGHFHEKIAEFYTRCGTTRQTRFEEKCDSRKVHSQHRKKQRAATETLRRVLAQASRCSQVFLGQHFYSDVALQPRVVNTDSMMFFETASDIRALLSPKFGDILSSTEKGLDMTKHHITAGVFSAGLILLFCLDPFGGTLQAPATTTPGQKPESKTPVKPPPPNKHLEGTEKADVLEGGEGHDTLDGRAGDDWLFGETGDDRLHGGDGSDTLDGGPGTDMLIGGPGDDLLNDARPESDEVDENDVLLGGEQARPNSRCRRQSGHCRLEDTRTEVNVTGDPGERNCQKRSDSGPLGQQTRRTS